MLDNIPMPPEPQEPWQNPFRIPVKPNQPTKAEVELKQALRQDACSHIGRLGKPAWVK